MNRKTLIRRLFIAVFFAVILFSFIICIRAGRSSGEIYKNFSEEEAEKEILFYQDHVFTSKDTFVRVVGNRVVINRGGTYLLRGDFDDGQIVVDVGKDEEVKLKLQGLSIRCRDSAPLYVRRAKKVTLKLKDGSENSLSDTASDREDGTKACVYADSDLTIKGEGALTVKGSLRHGIFSTKDLKIRSGRLTVKAVRQALHGKKSVLIDGGSHKLKAGTDGVHSNGELTISSCKLEIDARKYGMYAYSGIHVDKKTARVQVRHALSEAGCQGGIDY